VKFSGDIDPSSRSDPEALKKMDAAARAGSLHFKPLYQRALVAAAGPLANFVLAIAIFTIAFTFSTHQVTTDQQPIEPPVVAGFTKDSTAEAAGIQIGDVIRSIDGKPINRFTDLQKMVTESGGRQLRIGIDRSGQPLEIVAAPRVIEITDEAGNKSSAMRLGLVPGFKPLSLPDAFVNAADRTWFIIERTVGYLGNLVIGHASTHELSGPLGIAKAAGDFAADGFIALLNLTAYISVAVGFANLLPIPVLDGGHLLYYGFEAILGRPLGERAQEVGFRLGLAFVLFLMLLTTFNDLVRFNLF